MTFIAGIVTVEFYQTFKEEISVLQNLPENRKKATHFIKYQNPIRNVYQKKKKNHRPILFIKIDAKTI